MPGILLDTTIVLIALVSLIVLVIARPEADATQFVGLRFIRGANDNATRENVRAAWLASNGESLGFGDIGITMPPPFGYRIVKMRDVITRLVDIQLSREVWLVRFM